MGMKTFGPVIGGDYLLLCTTLCSSKKRNICFLAAFRLGSIHVSSITFVIDVRNCLNIDTTSHQRNISSLSYMLLNHYFPKVDLAGVNSTSSSDFNEPGAPLFRRSHPIGSRGIWCKRFNSFGRGVSGLIALRVYGASTYI